MDIKTSWIPWFTNLAYYHLTLTLKVVGSNSAYVNMWSLKAVVVGSNLAHGI